MFTQMLGNCGINIFVEKYVVDIIKEFNQLDKGAMPGKLVVQPIDPTLLTEENKSTRNLDEVNLII